MSLNLVNTIRNESPELKVQVRKGKDGKTYDTTNIGKNSSKPGKEQPEQPTTSDNDSEYRPDEEKREEIDSHD